ncbi:MAG: glycosyltransferase, partial [Gammaproteobacteria bacterium]
LEEAGADYLDWDIGRKSVVSLRHVLPLRRLLRSRQVDILHARSRLPAWIAYAAWRSLRPSSRPRFVTTVHGLYSVNRYSAIMTRGEPIIAISATVRDCLLKNYPAIDPGRVRVIYRGVDPAVYSYAYEPPTDWRVIWEREMPMLIGRMVLTLPARISRRKGHQDFIELIAGLKDRGVPAHGLIAGSALRAHLLDELRAQVARRKLEGHITFLGHRTDVREIMAVSNLVFCLSKAPEAFGRTTLEALSLGVPVIAYDHGGVREILARMFPEGAVPAGDLGALLEKTVDFVRSPRQVAPSTPFTLRTMLDQTLALYETPAG